MSRHRSVRKIFNCGNEIDFDEDEFHRYSISEDESTPVDPAEAQYLYRRSGVGVNNPVDSARIADYIREEGTEVFVDDDIAYNSFDTNHQRGLADSGASGVLRVPEVANLRISGGPEFKNSRKGTPHSSSQNSLTPSVSSRRLTALAVAQAATSSVPKLKRRANDEKPLINMVIVGHVDAGKSTLMGHLLFLLGSVDDKTMHRYKQDSAKSGKASFAYAWVMDDTQEERDRGVTMDIAKTSFSTENRRIVVLDAPGHKDFIPNMINGASQADAALLVVNSSRGEFETGYELGGQTREHAMLLRSLGVNGLLVVVNKLDTIDWSKQRYDEVCNILKDFLKRQAGFPSVRFVPVSGLEGVNLTSSPPEKHPLREWYQGPTLLELIDELSPPVRSEDCKFRAVINDVLKNAGNQLVVNVKMESGFVEVGEKIFVMPNADAVTVKAILADNKASESCYAGEQAVLTLTAISNIEPEAVLCGHVLSRGGMECLLPGKRFLVRIVIFNIVVPIIKGTKAELFAHSICEPCTIVRLRAAVSKADGEVSKKKPRCLTKNMGGIVEIETERVICLETYSECKGLGRITLRSGDQTIAAGIVEQLLQ